MKKRFYIVDVFTAEPFGGNPLAVLPDARGLETAEMQSIAAELGFSETTFVLPPSDAAHARCVRIFTPREEIPFAGHPNVGTAFVLAETGEIPVGEEPVNVVFEEGAGLVPLSLRREGERGAPLCRLEPPQRISLGEEFDPAEAAALLRLAPDDVSTRCHPPVLASVGLPFLFVELTDSGALARAAADEQRLRELLPTDRAAGIHLYTRLGDQDVRARMFAPLHGVPEDPATGSAACGLAGLLARFTDEPDGRFEWRIAQGVEMGRTSQLRAGADKQGGEVTRIWVEGRSALVAEGTLRVPDRA